MDIVGYADRWSIAPGEVLTVFVSCRERCSFEANIVRLVSGPRTGDAFSIEEELVDSTIGGSYAGEPQDTACGSYAVVPSDPAFDDTGGTGVEILIWPTLFTGQRTLIARIFDATGFALRLMDGYPALSIGKETVLVSPVQLMERRWYRLRASIDAVSGETRLEVAGVFATDGIAPWSGECWTGVSYRPAIGTCLTIAALERGQEAFDGKIEAPKIVAADGTIIAAWDFARGIAGRHVEDTGRNGLHGELVNQPTRAVTGIHWTPDITDWREDPRAYGAIHFHADDLSDVGWKPSFAWTLPADLPSGVYAVRLKAGDAVDRVPFFVRPRRGTSSSDVAVLLPTATYMAYANDHQAFDKPRPERSVGRPIVLQPQDLHLDRHREIGLSLYDRHADGSGVHVSSRFRPVLTMRPLYRRWDGADGVGLRWFGLDLLLIGWLNRLGRGFDVLTDEDLDREGVDLLARYRVVMTGNQPEYASSRMLDAIEAYTMRGGRLMYLGGNGFYWRVAFHPTEPGMIELRRGHDGAGAWVSGPGESRHAFTGENGGTWRTLGRPPQRLVGVGFVAEGFTRSGPYMRMTEGDDPSFAFVFEGLPSRTIGSEGLSGGGAAGIEIDRADPTLGTPANAVVLARAGVPSVWYSGCALEAMAGGVTPPSADMVLFTRPGGGAVFSTGSIAWIGALPCNGDRNDVSRLTANVLRRFLDPTPLTLPSERRSPVPPGG